MTIDRPRTLEEWWSLRPPMPTPDDRALARLNEVLVKPIESAHATLIAFTDVMCAKSHDDTEGRRIAWSLGFQIGLGIAMQVPEGAREFYQAYHVEVARDFETTVEQLEAEDRHDADYFLDIWQAKRRAS